MKYFKIENLSFKYDDGKEYIFENFSLEMDREEFILIKGRSGIGKSSLLKLISGLEKPITGTIIINGKDITNVDIEKRKLGYLFQDFALFPHLNVFQNISYGISNLNRKDREKRVKELLKLIELEGFEKRYPSSLSGGEKQRVAIARAIANNPTLLLLDEPFSSLNIELKDKIRNDLRKILKKEKITTIIVSHDEQDETIVDRVINI